MTNDRKRRPFRRGTGGDADPTRRRVVGAVALAALLPFTGALAQPIPRPRVVSRTLDATTLEPGQFIFEPELSPEGPVVVIVSLPDQLVHVYRNGVEIAVSTCSTGKPGHATPTGVFVVLQKDKHHRSSTYNNAPMPNMQRLTWRGIALHAGNLPGYPASHGCVRLPMAFSEKLFEIGHLGMPVIIADEKSEPSAVVHPGLLLPPEAEAEAMAAVAAAAAKAHHGPDATTDTHDVVSIVVSAADRRLVMLRDGEEVFSSSVTIRDPERPLGNHVYKMLEVDGDGREVTWLAHRIHATLSGGGTPEAVLSRIAVDDWIGAVSLLADLRPGSTVVVTELPASAETRSGADFVIIHDV